MENAKLAKFKKVSGIVLNVLLWIFVVFSVLTTILVFSAQGSEDGVPALFGKSLITIETPSMEDTYSVGDLVFMKKVSLEEIAALEPGTIITYHAPIDINNDGVIGDINTHRIYSNDPDSLRIVTQGDNNLLPDNEGDNPYTVHYTDVIGVCTEDGKMGGIGNVINFLKSSLGFFICILLPLILFFLYELYNFISIIVTERAKRAPVSKETEEEIKARAIEEYLKAQAEAKENSEEASATSEEEKEDK